MSRWPLRVWTCGPKFLLADVTAKGLHACVDSAVMPGQILCMVKPLSTLPADERLFSIVDQSMCPQILFLSIGLTTNLTHEGLFASVYVHVSGELTLLHAGFATNLTHKALLSHGVVLVRV